MRGTFFLLSLSLSSHLFRSSLLFFFRTSVFSPSFSLSLSRSASRRATHSRDREIPSSISFLSHRVPPLYSPTHFFLNLLDGRPRSLSPLPLPRHRPGPIILDDDAPLRSYVSRTRFGAPRADLILVYSNAPHSNAAGSGARANANANPPLASDVVSR